MKYLSYIWTVFTNLIVLFVALTIFGSAYSSFETIVFSLLVLIYITLISFTGVYGQAKSKELFAMHGEFRRLRNLLKEKMGEDDEEFETEEIKRAQDNAKRDEVKFYINAVFLFLIYIIVLWNLFAAL